MKITDETIDYVAALSKIELTTKEKEKAKGFILYDHEHDILFGMSSGFFINKPKSLRKSTVFENSK